jgi:RNA-directed DNA polymerase
MEEDEHSQLELMLLRPNMQRAWKAVKANDGAAGVDGKTIAQTREQLKRHWPQTAAQLRRGRYRPAAVREVLIPKADGRQRTLGIPTVQDRLIQQAMLQVLDEEFDPAMSAHSYGFRRGRSAHDALRAASGHVAAGKGWVVDIDLKDFFNQIDHDILMREVSRKVWDKRVLKLIGGYLRAPMQSADGTRQGRVKGVPQGGPLSPLLSNIYLDMLDKELERRGVAFVRYADDVAIFAGSPRAAQRIYEGVVKWLSAELKLQVNADKSGVGPSDEGGLLGYRIESDGELSVAPKALEKMKQRVRQLWDGRQSVTLAQLRQQWREYIVGWWNYFALAEPSRSLRGIGGWIRRHMRKYFWLRWHNRQGRRNALERLGVTGRSLGVAGSRRGAWRMARHAVLQQALKTVRLHRWGLSIPWEPARS